MEVKPTPSALGYGVFSLTDGVWTYALLTNNTAVRSLRLGETLSDTFTFTASNGLVQQVTVTIQGIDANNLSNFDPPYVDNNTSTIGVFTNSNPTINAAQSNNVSTSSKSASLDRQIDPNDIQLTNDGIDADIFALNKNTKIENASGNVSFIEKLNYDLSTTRYENKGKSYFARASHLPIMGENSYKAETDDVEFWSQINKIRKQLDNEGLDGINHPIDVQILYATSLGLTAGFVTWLLRGGSLLASLMSTIPLLKKYDPVPILVGSKKSLKAVGKTSDEEDEAVESNNKTHDVNDDGNAV